MPDAYVPLRWTSLKVEAKRVGVGARRLYIAAAAGELKAKRVNARGDWKTLPEWVDAWLLAMPSARREGRGEAA